MAFMNPQKDRYIFLATIIYKHFGIYGYGNFSLTIEDVATLLQALDDKDPEKALKELYVRLEAIRMV